MANGMELTPKLPDCFLMGPSGMNVAGSNNTTLQHEGIGTANTGMKRPVKQKNPIQPLVSTGSVILQSSGSCVNPPTKPLQQAQHQQQMQGMAPGGGAGNSVMTPPNYY